MPVFEIETPAGSFEVEAPDEATALKAVEEFATPRRGHNAPEFQPIGVEGYDPATGEVTKPAGSGIEAALSSTLEGIPVAGPILQTGVENAAAGIGSAISGKPFSQVRSEMGDIVDKSQEDHPYITAAGNVGGAVLGTIPMVMAAPGAFGVGMSLPAATAMGGVSGAALGGADAAVRSGGDAKEALKGAAWGGVLGAVAPTAGKLIGSAVGSIANRVRAPGVQTPTGAQRAISRAAGSDAIDDVAARLADAGDAAMPMDLGPNLQRQAGALAATPGRGQEIIRSAVAQRQQGAGSRIMSALDDALGGPIDTLAAADDIIAKRAAAAKPLYDAAYKKPVPFTRELEDLLKRPTISKALSRAQTLAADEGIPSPQWFASIADDGTVAIKNVPDVRQLDLTKRALDDMINAAQRSGSNNEARIFTNLKEQLVKMVDDAVPEYAAARKAFSGPASILDAMEQGSTLFSRQTTPAQILRDMAKMDKAQREAFQQGARAQVADIMGTARNDALAARNAFSSGYNKEKLELVVGKERAGKLLRALDNEALFTRTRDVVTGNSETAARIAAQQEVGAGAKNPGLFRNAANMRFGDVAAGLGDKVFGSMRTAAQDKLNEELARILTSSGSIGEALKVSQAAQARGEITAAQARLIANSILQAASPSRNAMVISPQVSGGL